MMATRSERSLLVGLLALLPVLAFALARPAPEVGLAAVSVVLIVASLYLMWAGIPHALAP